MTKSTPQARESFVWVENPTLTADCSICGAGVKSSIEETDSPVFLSIPYRIRTIKIFPGGRSFEKVDSTFIHVCPQPVATESNSIGSPVVGVTALL